MSDLFLARRKTWAWGIHGSLIVTREPSVRCVDSHVDLSSRTARNVLRNEKESLSREQIVDSRSARAANVIYLRREKTKRIFRQERDTLSCSSLARSMKPTRRNTRWWDLLRSNQNNQRRNSVIEKWKLILQRRSPDMHSGVIAWDGIHWWSLSWSKE